MRDVICEPVQRMGSNIKDKNCSYQPQSVINGLIFMYVEGWGGGSSVSTDLNVYERSDLFKGLL